MKKFLSIVILFLISCNSVLADGELWDNFGDQNTYGNSKYVSDKDFQQAIDSKKGKKKEKPKMKGSSYQESNETSVINQIPEELPVVCINTNIKINDDAILPVGHYQIASEKRANKIYLKLYQGHYLITEFEAIETLDDFDEPEINFANFITDGNIYKLIYGSIDYNAYVNLEAAE